MGDWVSASLGRPSNDSPGLVAGRGMAAQPGWMAAQATGELVPTQHLDQCTRGPLEVRPRFLTPLSWLFVGNCEICETSNELRWHDPDNSMSLLPTCCS